MKEWLKAASPEDVGKFYDDQYSRDGFDALSKGRWIEIVEKLIEKGGAFSKRKRLLEAGCGHGQFLSEVCDDLECVGIDVSAEAIKLARERLGEDAVLINGPMEDLPDRWNLGVFDYVVSFGALEHTMNPKKCFDNLLAMTKPGGIVFVIVPLEFEDCFKYIRDEKIQSTNERFAGPLEWLDYFGNRQESWWMMGPEEMQDIAIITRKEAK